MSGQNLVLRDISDVDMSGTEEDESILKFDADTHKLVLRAPDKVYTALLTEVSPTTLTSGTLVVGMRYTITTMESGDDFTNVGAAANESDVVFIATGTTPAVWTEGSELDSDGAPIATVLENTLGGEVVWSYTEGVYTGTLDGAFTVGKTVIHVAASTTATALVAADSPSADTVRVLTFDSGVAADDILDSTALFIKVFP